MQKGGRNLHLFCSCMVIAATRYREYKLDKVGRFMQNKVKKHKSFQRSFDVTKVTNFSKHSGGQNLYECYMGECAYYVFFYTS